MKSAPGSPLKALQPPTISGERVGGRRSDLIAQQIQECSLMVLAAPLGYGKTTLMVQAYHHVARLDNRCIWLSLTEEDRNFGSLLNKLKMALEALAGSDLALRVPGLRHHFSSRDDPQIFSERVQAYVGAMARPVYLFVDNYHLVESSLSNRFLEDVLGQGNANFHLILSSRTEPAFAFGHWQVSGKAILYEAEDLRFNRQDIEAFFRHSAEPAVTEDDLDLILAKTEGWPVAVQLCALLLERKGNSDYLQDFSGGQKEIGRYLNEQVFNSLSDKVRYRLVRLALFDDFDVALLNAALGVKDSRTLLDELLRQQLFIYPTRQRDHHYRFHPMFRTFLLSCSEAPDEREQQKILAAAAQYCARHQRTIEAVKYALGCRDYTLARGLLVESAQRIVRDEGLLPNFVQWCETIPDEDSSQSLNLKFWLAWALTYSGRYVQAGEEIERIRKSVASSHNLSRLRKKKMQGRLITLDISIAIFLDREKSTQELAEKWLSQYRRSADPFDVAVVAAARCLSARLRLNYAEAKRSLTMIESMIQQAVSPYGRMWAAIIACLLEMEFGSFIAARRIIEPFYKELKYSTSFVTSMHSTMALLLAKLAFESDQLFEAENLCREGMVHIMDHGVADSAAAGVEVNARLTYEKNRKESQPVLKKMAALVAHYPPRMQFLLGRVKILLLLAENRIEEAVAEASMLGIKLESRKVQLDTDDSNDWVYTERQLLAAYLLFHRRRREEARQMLQQIQSQTSTEQRPYFYVRVLILDVALLFQKGDTNAACKKMIKALELGEANGFCRVFIEAKPYIDSTLQLIYARRLNQGGNQYSAYWYNLIERLGVAEAYRQDVDTSQLTRKEKAVIEMLPTTMSVQELADYFFVSKAAIKWHLNNIYKKFGVSNRHGAIAVARANDLLP